MFRIEARPNGFVLTLAGAVGIAEMTLWYLHSVKRLATVSEPFSLIVDARKLNPLGGHAQLELVEGQVLYRTRGLIRSAVITTDEKVGRQLQRLAEQSGIASRERYIDASTVPDWQLAAVAWARHGIEPAVFLAVRPSTGGRRRARAGSRIGHSRVPQVRVLACSRTASRGRRGSRLRKRERCQE